jgi:N-ethylmaleimide reductase
MIAFGRPFIANPDLPFRLQNELTLNEPLREYFFGSGEKGYLDYTVYR